MIISRNQYLTLLFPIRLKIGPGGEIRTHDLRIKSSLLLIQLSYTRRNHYYIVKELFEFTSCDDRVNGEGLDFSKPSCAVWSGGQSFLLIPSFPYTKARTTALNRHKIDGVPFARIGCLAVTHFSLPSFV
jgi:hypothetical protein